MTNYQKISHQIKDLTLAEQLNLLEYLAKLVRQQTIRQPERSIMELEGLGKDIWQGLDAQEYVNRERDSWNG